MCEKELPYYSRDAVNIQIDGKVISGYDDDSIVINKPWYKIVKADSYSTMIEALTIEKHLVKFSLKNDSESLKRILESDPFGETLLSAK